MSLDIYDEILVHLESRLHLVLRAISSIRGIYQIKTKQCNHWSDSTWRRMVSRHRPLPFHHHLMMLLWCYFGTGLTSKARTWRNRVISCHAEASTAGCVRLQVGELGVGASMTMTFEMSGKIAKDLENSGATAGNWRQSKLWASFSIKWICVRGSCYTRYKI